MNGIQLSVKKLTLDVLEDFLKNIPDNGEECYSDETVKLQSGEFDFSGKKGRVIINGMDAVKMNEEIGDFKLKERGASASSFFLQNIISLLISDICKEKIYSNIFAQYNHVFNRSFILCKGVYLCQNRGFSVYETCNRGNIGHFLSHFKNNTSILDKIACESFFDISVMVSMLFEEYNFIHNDLKVANVLVSEDEAGIVSYKISDFDNSFIRCQGISLSKEDNFFEKSLEIPKRRRISNDFYEISGIKINEFITGAFFRSYKEKNINLDIYTYLLSLIFDPSIRENLDSLPFFNRLVDYIFTNDDIEKIKHRLYEEPEEIPRGINKLTGFLICKNFRLRYNLFARVTKFFDSYYSLRP